MERKQFSQFFGLSKKSLCATLLFLGVLDPAESFSQPQSCNLNALRAANTQGWDFLMKVTKACGQKNPNNLGGHFITLNIDPGIESRAIARQIRPDETERFSIILVTGRTDPFSGEFLADSMMVEVSNISNPMVLINDPLSRLGGGFFVLKMGLDGKYLDGFRYKGGTNTHLRPLDAAIVSDYLKDYWNEYFASTSFIASSEGLAN